MNHRRCVLNRDKNNNVVKAVKKVAQGPARDEVFGLSQKLQLSALRPKVGEPGDLTARTQSTEGYHSPRLRELGGVVLAVIRRHLS